LVCIVLAEALLAAPPGCAADDYIGIVTGVADGDTFYMRVENRKVRIRLCGIDSPERGEPGYGAGAPATLIEGKQVHCLQVGPGTPCDGRSKAISLRRAMAQCFIGDKDIAAEMCTCSRPEIGLVSTQGITGKKRLPA
jgi:endonuclease YncB( thermonuclease family)